jgi:hypothetical protein
MLCGRDEEISRIVEDCRAERMSVIVAEPSLGITSLLRKGVLPALRNEAFIVAIVDDWQGRYFAARFRESIAEAVREQADPLFYTQGEPLDEMLRNIRTRTRPNTVVILDQFEDYLRGHSNSEISDAFDAELAHAAGRRDGRFIIALQEHALPEFERLRQYIPNLRGFETRLRPLTQASALEAAVAAARQSEIEIEPAALDALIAAPVLQSGSGINPSLLKVAVSQLADACVVLQTHTIAMETIAKRGGVDRIVLESRDAELNAPGASRIDLFFRWCNILISPEKHRLAVTEKGLTDYAGKLSRFVPSLLPVLIGSWLLRPFENRDSISYEIARESLVPIVRDWWERREASITARRRAIFRVRSLSVAAGSTLIVYLIWLIMSAKT